MDDDLKYVFISLCICGLRGILFTCCPELSGLICVPNIQVIKPVKLATELKFDRILKQLPTTNGKPDWFVYKRELFIEFDTWSVASNAVYFFFNYELSLIVPLISLLTGTRFQHV